MVVWFLECGDLLFAVVLECTSQEAWRGSQPGLDLPCLPGLGPALTCQVKGVELPAALSPEHVPPSLRTAQPEPDRRAAEALTLSSSHGESVWCPCHGESVSHACLCVSAFLLRVARANPIIDAYDHMIYRYHVPYHYHTNGGRPGSVAKRH